jgi:hypothetical protein
MHLRSSSKRFSEGRASTAAAPSASAWGPFDKVQARIITVLCRALSGTRWGTHGPSAPLRRSRQASDTGQLAEVARGALAGGFAIAAVLSLSGCDRVTTPARPSLAPESHPSTANAEPLRSQTTVSWECIAKGTFGRAAGCLLAPAPAATVRAAATLPGAPTGLAATVSGSTVVLVWNPPSADTASYFIEAGSTLGNADLATLFTGTPATSLTVLNVPGGVYFVRVRASNAAGIGPASPDIVVTVGGGVAACPPIAPGALSSVVAGSTVSLTWNPSGGPCVPAAYLLEAGSGPGLANIANFSTGSTATSYTATGVGAGTYYVRVRATNSRGTSGPSDEIIVSVGTTSCSYVVNPTAQSVSSSGESLSASMSSSCAWSAASDQPWLTINSGSSGVGNGTVAYLVAANPSSTSRTGHITFSGTGGTVQLTVTQSGVGTPTTTSSIPATTTTSSSTTTSSTTSTTSTICPGAPPAAVIIGDPNRSPDGSRCLAAKSCLFNGSTSTGTGLDQWTWDFGDGTPTASGVMVSHLYPNFGVVSSQRDVTVSLTVRDSCGRTNTASRTITVYQFYSGCGSFSVSPASRSVSAAGGPFMASLAWSVPVSWPCNWSVVSEDPMWLTISSASRGVGDGTVTYSVAQNTSTSSRTGHITFSGELQQGPQVTVIQSGAVINSQPR